jgi:diguanylate cyclase (GGDEF)-like protein
VASAILGIALVVLSLFVSQWTGRQHAAAQRDAQLRSDVEIQTSRVNEYFSRARTYIRLLAQNPSLAAVYNDPTARPRSTAAMDQALSYLGELYPNEISEVCYIDIGGHELSRVVRNEIAPQDQLAVNETQNPFFAPTFALSFGEVYQALPYLSPDTAEWVISNSTLVPTADKRKHAIVHYEISIASLGDSFSGLNSRTRVIDQHGLVMIDSNLTQDPSPKAILGFTGQHQFDGMLSANATNAVMYADIGDERIAYHRIVAQRGNANDWYVVTSAPARIGWTTGFGPASIALLVVGFGVLLISWRTWRSYQKMLHQLSLTDDLTGLPNRVLLHDRFQQAVKSARRNGGQSAVLLLDLDQFKEINDTLGHHRGDQLLQMVSARLSTVLRAGDTLARLGGDEFAIMLHSTDGTGGALAAAERVEQALLANFVIADVPLHVGASVGIAVYPDHGETIDLLMQHADVAMYRAKTSGSGHAAYEPEHDEYSTDQLSLVAELRDAIDRDGLELHYQPILDLGSGRMTGVEALVRWWHPVRGMVMPNDFIPAAERTGLIRPLTSWVLATGLRQLRTWRDEGRELTLAVNLSPKSLTDPELLFDISFALLDSGIDARHLVLEVTETSFISDPGRSTEALEEIRRLGVTVSIDDFGTGYSSLAYLRNLPIDEVKIDRSFVAGLTSNAADRSIVESTITLAHSLGFVVVAEGIEDEITLDRLRALGCDFAQGYHLGRPKRAAELESVFDGSAVTSPVDAAPALP